jgi:hypothetical protein
MKGAEDGDPIGVAALRDTCSVAMFRGISHLWLDRLCIVQTSKTDKSWQIRQMADIYCHSTISLVLPGGITRLVGLDEPTAWMERAWTLQEAILPRETLILFSWTGTGKTSSGTSSPDALIEVLKESSTCASTPLTPLLLNYAKPTFTVRIGDASTRFTPKVFGVGSHGRIPVHALAAVMQQTIPEARDQAIWRCALTRTSSRPVDMIFSIMGMFGVTLNPRAFKKHDRVRATAALARELLQQGKNASWLGQTLHIDPSLELSWAPQFPKTSIDSLPQLQMQGGQRDVRDMMSSVDYDSWIDGLPTGDIDVNGNFRFTAEAVALEPTQLTWFFKPEPFHSPEEDGGLLVRAKDGSIWRIVDAQLDSTSLETFTEYVRGIKPVQKPLTKRQVEPVAVVPPSYSRALMVFIGTQRMLRPARPTLRPRYLRALLLVEHSPGQFHRTSYFELDDETQSFIDHWSAHDICISGYLNQDKPRNRFLYYFSCCGV